MTASMTAFARVESEQSGNQLVWEVRSVNHRYLDIHLKLPEELRMLETECREHIAGYLNRGRIDAQLKLEQNRQLANSHTIDHGAVDAISLMIDQIRLKIPDVQPARVTDILRWPGVIAEPKQDNTTLHRDSITLLERAMEQLNSARHREGNRLAELISHRVELCRALVETLMDEIDEINTALKQKWQARIDELCQEIESTRIHQEIAILLTKSDIHEELDRLQTHFDELERVLAAKKPAGRRLDFLMQELNREANTLGSKSVDQRITNVSVELKVLIDQMREQVQNIE